MTSPSLSLNADDFALFGLPRQFAQDRTAIDAAWKQLQRQAHPDKFAAEGAAAQRLAMQWSVRINEAYQRLKDPLKRAAYVCELQGVPINAQTHTAMPPAFLMQQMEWREALDEAQSRTQLEDLLAQTQHWQTAAQARVAQLLDGSAGTGAGPVAAGADWVGDSGPSAQTQAAAQEVRQLLFVERFLADVHQRLDAF